jgi:hypothetical protein
MAKDFDPKLGDLVTIFSFPGYLRMLLGVAVVSATVGCRTVRDGSQVNAPQTAPVILGETTVGSTQLSQAYYLPYQGVEPFFFGKDAIKGFEPRSISSEVKQCAMQGIGQFSEIFANLTGETANFHQKPNISKNFVLWVNDYTQASSRVRRREAKLWHSSEQSQWIWSVTAYKDKQGNFQCETPEMIQVYGAVNAKLGIEPPSHRYAERRYR